MKFLLDTNIIFGIEDNRQVANTFSDLIRKCSEHNVRIYIDVAVIDDVERDKDSARKDITKSKLNKFEILKPANDSFIDRIIEATGAPLRKNDESDIRLLAALTANATDFLITEDLGLHRRANKAGLSDRVLTVADSLRHLFREFEPTEVHLPFIREIKAYEIDRDAEIFESLREDYPGFDHWFENKCAKLHRDCWIIEIRDEIAGLAIPKEEHKGDTDATTKGDKILKVCTLKLQPAYRGEKFGEQLLKKILWHAQSNKFDVVYLTTFDKQVALISLIEKFGFKKTKTKPDGEAIYEKKLVFGPLLLPDNMSAINADRLFYPRVISDDSVQKFIVPIQPNYHNTLFPEIAFAAPLPLFGSGYKQDLISYFGKSNRTPGNTIRKVYVCRSPNSRLRAGDLIFFYQSKDERFANSQTVTTLGVVEGVETFTDIDALTKHLARRSVFSNLDLDTMLGSGTGGLKTIDFLLIGHSNPSVPLNRLIDLKVFSSRPAQSISKINETAFTELKREIKLGFDL